jgi:TBC1 domain family protein 5
MSNGREWYFREEWSRIYLVSKSHKLLFVLFRFPDIEYFRDPDIQAQLTLILYIHSVTHPDIGYRQGMHELLAPIFLAVDYDSVPHTASSDIDSEIEAYCSREWVAADSWALFTIIMDGVHSWYEWREPAPVSLPPPLKTQFRYGGSNDDGDSMKPYVAPIVLVCQRLQSDLLRKSDPVLFGSMQNAGVEPQIYGMWVLPIDELLCYLG